jgi:hypothetical protein
LTARGVSAILSYTPQLRVDDSRHNLSLENTMKRHGGRGEVCADFSGIKQERGMIEK